MHIISVYLITFLPILFPVMGITSLNKLDWFLMFLYGIISYFSMIFFIKAC